MKYDYKMKFVAYLDKLTPEQRQLEIIDNLLASPRGKRTAKSKTTTEVSRFSLVLTQIKFHGSVLCSQV